MPDVFPAEVVEDVGDRRTVTDLACPVCQSMLLKPIGESIGMAGLSGRRLLGMPKGSAGARGRTATMVSISGLILTVSFQPSSFGSGRSDLAVPADTVDQLHIEDMEVDRVGIDTVVGDLPDLGAVGNVPG